MCIYCGTYVGLPQGSVMSSNSVFIYRNTFSKNSLSMGSCMLLLVLLGTHGTKLNREWRQLPYKGHIGGPDDIDSSQVEDENKLMQYKNLSP